MEEVEVIPLHHTLDALRRLREEIQRDIQILTEREVSIAAAILHISQMNVAGGTPASAVSSTYQNIGDEPVTDDRVLDALRTARQPMTIEQIAMKLRPSGDISKTYKAVRRVIVQKNGGLPSLVERGLVAIDKRIRPLTVSLTAAAGQSADSKA